MATFCSVNKLCSLPTRRVYVFRMIITINASYFPYRIKRLVFITDMESILFEAGAEYLSNQCRSSEG